MRKVIALCLALLTLSPLALLAQGDRMLRGGCTPNIETDEAALARGVRPMRLPSINNNWDPNRIYRQLVVLVSYSDTDFSTEDPKQRYNDMFNTPGFHQRSGVGCVAEYFQAQSNGILNLQFDVFGPYKVSTKAQPYTNPTSSVRNYQSEAMKEATRLMLQEQADMDFSPYDWNGNGSVNQVIYIHAGYTGNSSGTYGYIWPSTSSFSSITTPDNLTISNYTASAELWPNKSSCGIGTIIHEFSHSLGLPDIYPTNSNAGYSVVDEWDMMDGGNYTNYGWCPPNYTPTEKMLMGWLEPIELTEPATITDMKPSAEGGPVYLIRHSSSEWLLLENRQQKGWDFGIPGKGLVIYHVNYDKSVWSGNTVNNSPNKRRFELVHADNLDYDAWDNLIVNTSSWANSGRLNNKHLSTSPYPWSTDSTVFVNDALTDSSVPAAKMNYPNLEGSYMLSKPITNIRMDDDGLISFDFLGGTTAIRDIRNAQQRTTAVYDLNGRRINSFTRPRICLIRREDGTMQKVFK